MPTVRRTLIVACAALLVITASFVGAKGRPSQGGDTSDCQQALVDRFESLDTNTLDEDTIDQILLLREEEKLARDVYLTLSWWYDMPVFPNIARSEQQHMNLVALMLDRYDLPDPAEGNGIGEFDDPWVQGLYNDLIALGATPKEMMRRGPEFTYRRLTKAARIAEERGARLMGLGAFTKVVGEEKR